MAFRAQPARGGALLAAACLLALSLFGGRPAVPAQAAGGAWTTFMFDNARDGHSTADPAFGTVGPAWTSPGLNGQIYAEPLVYGGVVYVATENDQLYALNQANGAILKQWNLGGPAGGFRCGNINGITGTPVIDTVNRVLYAVGATNTAPTYKLFKVDLANYSAPVQSFNAQSLTGFDPTIQGQRGALALNNGTVYVPYGGRAGDCGVYHGYVAAFDLNGNPVGAFETTPHSCAGGVWSPGGESVDGSGNVYAGSGNGPTSGLTGCSPTNMYDYQESVLKLSATAGLVANWAPQNWLSLDQGDTDIGSVTPTLLPGGLIFQSGKTAAATCSTAARWAAGRAATPASTSQEPASAWAAQRSTAPTSTWAATAACSRCA